MDIKCGSEPLCTHIPTHTHAHMLEACCVAYNARFILLKEKKRERRKLVVTNVQRVSSLRSESETPDLH